MENTFNNRGGEALQGRRWLFVGAIFSLLFLCYGSLVPLDFEYKPFGEAWAYFVKLLFEGLDITSRTDLGENFLLMIPVGFFCMGALWPNEQRRWIFPLATALWIVCLTSSFTIEFAQIFFRGRTPSFSDVLMQSIGSLAGIITWCLWGYKIWPHFFYSTGNGKTTRRVTKILWIYLLVLVGYSVVPLDVTINPYSIYKKYKAGRIVLLPFSFNYGHISELFYAVATDVLIWVPVGFLWCLSKVKKVLEACMWTLFAVVTLELTQIFISSRIFDLTDIILGSLGGIGGVVLALKIPIGEQSLLLLKNDSSNKYKWTWIGLALFVVWLLCLALIFWFPYDILIERKFIESQLNRFFQVPFYAYYYSSGLTALTAVLRKTLFFVPLGVFAAIACRPLRSFGVDSLLFLISLFSFIGAAAIIELGQALIPTKMPDSTDLFFEAIGGLLGYCMTRHFIKRSAVL